MCGFPVMLNGMRAIVNLKQELKQAVLAKQMATLK